ncbi:Uncharacterised protein [Legionella steigerwaltii]|uniref:Uncharacterized protein n=1 Tax=Legionella steigerwaltii TaxID=460 RepID=A0A378L9G9_9GAMM|nr:hypothetical protein [Legionella steigerwaltii]KTD80836.1 hypothetical protein Lstg_0063 [Legionella steigerwaltii]STY23476.1 Uncharacterised protein [Legionella steigerwaltii]
MGHPRWQAIIDKFKLDPNDTPEEANAIGVNEPQMDAPSNSGLTELPDLDPLNRNKSDPIDTTTEIQEAGLHNSQK